MSSPTADGFGPVGGDGDVARRKVSYAKWRRRSRQIHLYRRALPALIAAILLTLGGSVLYNTVAWRFAGGDGTAGVSIRMVSPKFYGRSSDNSPYLVSAASAVRDERDFKKVELDKPVFIVNLGTPIQTRLQAAKGTYREDTAVLRLEKDLVVEDKRGYTFKTQRAVVDTKSGSIQGESPIEGLGPLGRIAASSYAVTDGGERIIFRGDVRTRIDRPAR
jgi:lipopolysaccharide export system protein LptC